MHALAEQTGRPGPVNSPHSIPPGSSAGKPGWPGCSHLYRSYPKLGVAGRHQLHDVVARATARRYVSDGATGGVPAGSKAAENR